MIKLSDPKINANTINELVDTIKSGNFVHGDKCIEFEREISKYISTPFTNVVSSGSAALHLSLLALDIGVGDAVIVPDFTFVATANVVSMVGAKVVLVDVEIGSYNLDPLTLEDCIKNWSGEEKLKAIIPVLEFGNPKHLYEYRRIADKYDLKMIEDAACAFGAYSDHTKVGTVGDLACFSFHPRKILTTGEGGAVTTKDEQLYRKITLLRSHGMERIKNEVFYNCIGLNYRLTNFQAVLGLGGIRSIDKFISKRHILFDEYKSILKYEEEKGLLYIPEILPGHTLQTFMITLNSEVNRDSVICFLKKHDIESGIGAQCLSRLSLYSDSILIGNKNSSFLYDHGLVLPIHEGMNKEDVEKVCQVLSLAIDCSNRGE